MRSGKLNGLSRIAIIAAASLVACLLLPWASFAQEHRVTVWEDIPCVLWTRGCTPTSSSMVLGLWDPTDWNAAYFGYGKLTDYWRELSKYSDGTGPLVNVPNVLDELRVAMGTDVNGNTWTDHISGGIQNVTNTTHGYNFSTGQTECTYSSWWFDNDWCWDTGINGIRDEINAGRAFVWSVGIDNQVGHSLAAFGYTDTKYVITYNTWTCPGTDYWYYSKYDNGTGLDWGYVDRVIPGGGWGGLTDLTTPNGGEKWFRGKSYDIVWYEDDANTWSADLLYSTDGGVSWTQFATVEPSSPGWKSYTWTIPTSVPATSKARVKIANYSGSSGSWVYRSADGSRENFTIASGPDLLIQSVAISPTSFWPNETATVTVTVKNQGVDPAGSFYVDIYKNRATAPTTYLVGDTYCSISGLAAGATTTCVQSVSYSAAGTNYLWAQVDTDQTIAESNETNNVYGPVTVNVVNPPDLTIQSMTLSPASPLINSNATVTVTVKNQGTGAASSSFYVEIYKNETTAPGLYHSGDTWCSIASLAAGATTTCTKTVSYAAVGSYKMWSQVDSWNSVRESNESNNVFGPTTVTVVAPDLTELSISAPPATATVGSVFSVTDTVKNIGTGNAAASYTRYYLSLDAIKNAGDILLTPSRSVGALAVAGSSTGTVSVTIPTTTAVASYYLLACADDTAVVAESNESNNCIASGAKVQIVALGDLIVYSLTGPSLVSPGAAIAISDTTKNQGTEAVGASYTNFYWSTNTTWDAADVLLGSRPVGALAAGAVSGPVSTTVTVPASATTGIYYIIAKADATGLVAEKSETNNTKYLTVKILPDLVVSALTGPSYVTPGVNITISDTTKNQGTGTAGASTTSFYWSTNTAFDAADVALGSRWVSVLSPGAVSGPTGTVVTVPASATAGTYYILAVADATGLVLEASETNNTKSLKVSILPDLVVSALTGPAYVSPGATITISDTTKNQGSGAAAASITSFYWSTNSTWDALDTLLKSRNVPVLAVGGISSATTNLIVPLSATTGTFYIIAKADATALVNEASETNNTKYLAVKILPDLVVSALTGPAYVTPGVPFTVSSTTANTGSGAAVASSTYFYLSANTTLDAADTYLASQPVGALTPGATFPASTPLTVPPGTLPGAYYIIAKADGAGVVSEGSETNNTKYLSVKILPDLVVSALTGPSYVAPGTAFTVSCTTANVGTGTAGASSTYFYLSSNTTWDAGDTYLASQLIGVLPAGGSSAFSKTMTVPLGTLPGTYYIIARADATNAVVEGSETNNTKYMTVKILPDLIVSALTGPTTVTAGSSITIYDTTKNQGTAAAGASITRLFWSANTTVEAADPVLGSRAVPLLGAGGLSGPAGTTITVPAGATSGLYYIIAFADATGVVAEGSETNNTKYLRVTVP